MELNDLTGDNKKYFLNTIKNITGHLSDVPVQPPVGGVSALHLAGEGPPGLLAPAQPPHHPVLQRGHALEVPAASHSQWTNHSSVLRFVDHTDQSELSIEQDKTRRLMDSVINGQYLR